MSLYQVLFIHWNRDTPSAPLSPTLIWFCFFLCQSVSINENLNFYCISTFCSYHDSHCHPNAQTSSDRCVHCRAVLVCPRCPSLSRPPPPPSPQASPFHLPLSQSQSNSPPTSQPLAPQPSPILPQPSSISETSLPVSQTPLRLTALDYNPPPPLPNPFPASESAASQPSTFGVHHQPLSLPVPSVLTSQLQDEIVYIDVLEEEPKCGIINSGETTDIDVDVLE